MATSSNGTIKIRELIQAKDAFTRDLVELIDAQIRGSQHLDILRLDFDGIHFVSRAFAHEFACLLERLDRKGVHPEICNISEDVKKMLAVVMNGSPRSELPSRPDLVPESVSLEQLEELV